jgi:3-hydroxyisobutyrate dehydrogenase-like beta-hydroxyacid dehydrogenase
MRKKKIGFIGLGLMGSNMVRRLLNENYEVVSVNRGSAKLISKEFSNFKISSSIKVVCSEVDLLLTCVDTADNLKNLFFSDDGVLASDKIPTTVIDFTTGKPSTCEEIALALKNHGSKYIDAPIGRTPAHALSGSLNLFLGCKKTEIMEVMDVLDDLAENLIFLDKLGSGTKIKLLTNYYGQLTTLVFGLILKSCDNAGVAKRDLVDVMLLGPLGSPMLEAIATHFKDNQVGDIEFSIKNALKDLQYYQDEISPNDEFCDLLVRNFLKVVDNGKGSESVGEIAKYVE